MRLRGVVRVRFGEPFARHASVLEFRIGFLGIVLVFSMWMFHQVLNVVKLQTALKADMIVAFLTSIT